jgi:hypothetical protein
MNHNCYTQPIDSHCLAVLSVIIHTATNILFKFDFGNESDYAQDYDLFQYLTQSRFVSIVAQFMIITSVDLMMVVITIFGPAC